MVTTVTGKNQVTLPAELVKALDLHPGVQIEWTATRDGALVGRRKMSRAEIATRLAGRGRKYLRKGSDPVRDLIQEREQEDAEEV